MIIWLGHEVYESGTTVIARLLDALVRWVSISCVILKMKVKGTESHRPNTVL